MKQPPVFPKEAHSPRPAAEVVKPNGKPAKRTNIFSKSRDIREDRGERQMKTTHNAQTMPHGK